MAQRWFERDGIEFGRGIGFFDAIYAFAITLLVTNLDVPPAEAWRSPSALFGSGLGDQLLGFVISFVVIAAFWRGNASLMSQFRGIDGSVIAANLLSVGLVVLLPFTTQGISESQLADLPLPTAIYAVNVAAALIALHLVREVGYRQGLIAEAPPVGAGDDAVGSGGLVGSAQQAGPANMATFAHPSRERWAWRFDLLAQVAVFVVSIPVAYLVGTQWAWMTWALLIVVAPLSGRRVERVLAEVRGTDAAGGAAVASAREDVAD